jgi:hypothetical protein
VRSRFNTDFAAILDRISAQAAAADGADRGAVAENLRNNFSQWFGDFLHRNYGPYAALRRYLRDTVPDLVEWVKMRRRYSVPLDRRKVLAKLREGGASEDYIRAFSAELTQVEDVISGPGFADFIRAHLPALAPETASKPTGAVTAQLGSLGRGQSA